MAWPVPEMPTDQPYEESVWEAPASESHTPELFRGSFDPPYTNVVGLRLGDSI